MMSRVNQGAINAKSVAGLTYQTQLPMLNTRPRQQLGQEQRNINEALCGGCAGPAEGLCARGLTGVKVDGCLCARVWAAPCSTFPRTSTSPKLCPETAPPRRSVP